jgi:3-oxoacyl-[acyl-carrier protein] reductase
MGSRLLLEGKRVLVTGASRGIGRAIAKAYAAHGARLVLCARSDELQQVGAELREAGAQVVAVQGDLSTDAFAGELVRTARKELGGLDVLVNNAGILRAGVLGMQSLDTARELMQVNVVSPLAVLQYAVRVMGRGGSVVNLASIAGTRGMEGVTAYAASKAAMVGLTLAASKELAPKGIRVNAIAPGFIDTDMTRGLAPDWYQRRVASIGLGRIGAPEDIANAAVFLGSDLSSYVTGQVLGVDGGMLA